MTHFTPTEWEILAHRLETPDAIADTLTDAAPGERPAVMASWDDVCRRAETLATRGREAVDLDNLSGLDRTILRECCEGSTYLQGLSDAHDAGEVSTGFLLNRYKAALSLANKLDTVVTVY
jgi:hypothetical protein